MRIDSAGIYSSQGIIQGRISQNQADIGKSAKLPEKKDQSVKFQEGLISSNITKSKTLTPAESDQIKNLFGQFDPEAINRSEKPSNVDVRPGRFVDIVV